MLSFCPVSRYHSNQQTLIRSPLLVLYILCAGNTPDSRDPSIRLQKQPSNNLIVNVTSVNVCADEHFQTLSDVQIDPSYGLSDTDSRVQCNDILVSALSKQGVVQILAESLAKITMLKKLPCSPHL